MRRRQTSRKDANQPEIVAALEAIGVMVIDLSAVGGGLNDLLCGKEVWKLVEVKDGRQPPCERQLTPAQVVFHAKCAERGLPCFVVKNVEEALSLFR